MGTTGAVERALGHYGVSNAGAGEEEKSDQIDAINRESRLGARSKIPNSVSSSQKKWR